MLGENEFRNCSLAAVAVQSFSRSSNHLGRCRSQVSLGTPHLDLLFSTENFVSRTGNHTDDVNST
jgi:hypothetical protein